RLLDVDEQADGALELRFAHEHDVVDVGPDQLAGDLARCLDGDAFGQRIAAHGAGLALDEIVHGRVERRLDANDTNVRVDALGGNRNAGYQAAAADRHDERIQLGNRSQHLQRHRALAGNDERIV